jgi:hypothetical protein
VSEIKFQGGWIASLSNGQTIFEAPARGKGELSAWQQLLADLKTLPEFRGCHISQMRLQRGGRTVTAIPRRNGLVLGYFQGYEAFISNLRRTQTLNQGIGTIINQDVFITWVNNQGDVWQDIRPLKEVWVHTDQRQLVDLI